MSDHIESSTLTRFREHELAGPEVLAIARHLSGCEECRLAARVPGDEWIAAGALAFAEEEEAPEVPVASPWRFAVAAAIPLLLAGTIAIVMSTRREATTEPAAIATVTPATPAEVPLVTVRDGKANIELLRDGSVRGIATQSESDAVMLRDALRDGVLPRNAAIAALAPVASTIRGSSGPAQFAVVRPVATAVIETRPTFSWKALPGAASYRVSVFDDDFHLVTESETLTKTSWTSTRDLERGATYRWQVTAGKTVAPGRDGEARFLVLSKAEADRVRASLAAYPDSDLMHALVLERSGVRQDAEDLLRNIAEQNPGWRLK